MPDRRRISKLLSLILRHRPDEFGLNMDEYGYIPLDEVVEAVQQRYAAVEEEDIRDLVETSRQRRFQIVEDRIRALYGHSFYVEMDGDPMEPPESLYLCVPAGQAKRMKEEGLRSEDRFYLHLSPTREVAESRAGTVPAPCLVEVRAADAAAQAGVEFWERGEVVLTRQAIGAEFVGQIVEIEAPAAPAGDEDEDGERGEGGESGESGNRRRRAREPRHEPRGGERQIAPRERRPRERPPRERQPSGSRGPSSSPRSLPGPGRANGGATLAAQEGASEGAPGGEKKMTYGRRLKFEQGSGRR